MICDELNESQLAIARELEVALAAHGLNLLCICGGALHTSGNDVVTVGSVTRQTIYEQARSYDVAGYIVLTDMVGNNAGSDAVRVFTEQFAHRPLVSLGMTLPGIASVTVDNYSAMSSLMMHMTRNPERTQFVFIRGFPDNPVSVERERAFRDVLARRNLPIDESLVIDGHFMAPDAFHAMEQLLQQRSDIDGVVAANDTMAMQAVHALRALGLRVPDDVLVCGFDGSNASEQCIPAISTIRVNVQEQVRACVRLLLTQIRPTDKTATDTLTPTAVAAHQHDTFTCSTELVIRDSSDEQSVAGRSGLNPDSLFDAREFSGQLLHAMERLHTPTGVHIGLIIDDIVGLMVNGAQHQLQHLYAALQLMHDNPQGISWWRHLQHQLSLNMLSQGHQGLAPDAVIHITALMSDIQTMISTVSAAERVREVRYQELVWQLRRHISESGSLEELLAVLRHYSEVFRIKEAFICIYERDNPSPDTPVRLIFQHPAQQIDLAADERFKPGKVLPGLAQQPTRNRYLIIEPLVTGPHFLGYLMISEPTGIFSGRTNFKALADSLSNALLRCYPAHSTH